MNAPVFAARNRYHGEGQWAAGPPDALTTAAGTGPTRNLVFAAD